MEHPLDVSHQGDGLLPEAKENTNQTVGEVGALVDSVVQGHAAVPGCTVEDNACLSGFARVEHWVVRQVPGVSSCCFQLLLRYLLGVPLGKQVRNARGVLLLQVVVTHQSLAKQAQPMLSNCFVVG